MPFRLTCIQWIKVMPFPTYMQQAEGRERMAATFSGVGAAAPPVKEPCQWAGPARVIVRAFECLSVRVFVRCVYVR